MLTKTNVYNGLKKAAEKKGIAPPTLVQVNDNGDGYIDLPIPPINIGRRTFYNYHLLIYYDKLGRLGTDMRIHDFTPTTLIMATGMKVEEWSQQYNHPHLVTPRGTLCMDGDNIQAIWWMMDRGDYGRALLRILLAAQATRLGSHHWLPPGAIVCHACDKDATKRCMSCSGSKPTCDEHAVHCAYCSAPVCESGSCSIPVLGPNAGGRRRCISHRTSLCPACGDEYLNGTGQVQRCSSCHQPHCLKCSGATCQICSNRYCTTCSDRLVHGTCPDCVNYTSSLDGRPYRARRCINGNGCVWGNVMLPRTFFEIENTYSSSPNDAFRRCLDCRDQGILVEIPAQLELPLAPVLPVEPVVADGELVLREWQAAVDEGVRTRRESRAENILRFSTGSTFMPMTPSATEVAEMEWLRTTEREAERNATT